ncbi:hypothetical protein ACJX0J_016934, partial [Zea mays]
IVFSSCDLVCRVKIRLNPTNIERMVSMKNNAQLSFFESLENNLLQVQFKIRLNPTNIERKRENQANAQGSTTFISLLAAFSSCDLVCRVVQFKIRGQIVLSFFESLENNLLQVQFKIRLNPTNIERKREIGSTTFISLLAAVFGYQISEKNIHRVGDAIDVGLMIYTFIWHYKFTL